MTLTFSIVAKKRNLGCVASAKILKYLNVGLQNFYCRILRVPMFQKNSNWLRIIAVKLHKIVHLFAYR